MDNGKQEKGGGKKDYNLFDLLHQEHGILPSESQLDEIVEKSFEYAGVRKDREIVAKIDELKEELIVILNNPDLQQDRRGFELACRMDSLNWVLNATEQKQEIITNEK